MNPKTPRRHLERSERSPHSVAAARPFALLIALFVVPLGCKSAPAPTASTKPASTAAIYPARPTVAPPAFKLFHRTDNSLTLVTADDATDAQIAAIIYQLRDEAHNRTFDAIHLPQTFIDHRNPAIYFHLYRSAKCAAEKYAAGEPPCGASYHAAGDFSLGTFGNPNWEDGELIHGDDHETPLWNSDAPNPEPPAPPSQE